MRLPKKNVLVTIGGDKNKYKLLESVRKLVGMGFNIFATEHTSEFLKSHDIDNKMIYKAHNLHKKDNVLSMMDRRELDFVINIPSLKSRGKDTDGYHIRRKAVDYAIPLITDVNVARLFVDAISRLEMDDLKIKSWEEYR
jgi:carbamoyl-phosphate synthase large subunit